MAVKLRLQWMITIRPEVDMNVCACPNFMAYNSCQGIQTTNVNLMVALEEKSEDRQSQ